MTTTGTAEPYDVEGASPGFRQLLEKFTRASIETRHSRPARLDVPYGPGAAEQLDIFLTKTPNAPIVIFLHGGGWCASSKGDRSFPAEVFGPAGAIWISMEYPLAPGANLDEMVQSVRRGIAWVHGNAASFGGDAQRIHLCGNSAGGHLVGMALGTDWPAWGMPADAIKGATTISGVFHMTPLMKSLANGWLHMDLDMATRNSPIFNLPAKSCPLLCTVGTDEPVEFIEQSEAFVAAWRHKGYPASFLPMEGKHHFSIIAELGHLESPLVKAIFEQVGL